MCRYAETPYKVHYVCVPCRKSNKYPADGAMLAARDPYRVLDDGDQTPES